MTWNRLNYNQLHWLIEVVVLFNPNDWVCVVSPTVINTLTSIDIGIILHLVNLHKYDIWPIVCDKFLIIALRKKIYDKNLNWFLVIYSLSVNCALLAYSTRCWVHARVTWFMKRKTREQIIDKATNLKIFRLELRKIRIARKRAQSTRNFSDNPVKSLSIYSKMN